MTLQNYQAQYHAYLSRAEKALEQTAAVFLPEQSAVCEAARYSLFGGGKRVRAILTLAVCEMLNGNEQAAERFAAAVEMLHCYSLIHDDLPCMDDDDYRRGRLSCHKKFGETIATLAGDVLLTEAFDVIVNTDAEPVVCRNAAKALAAGSGSRGMIYGQELDIEWEKKSPDREILDSVHHYKTGALINAAVQMGTAAAQADDETCRVLAQYAFDLGLVFQIVDDVLDVTSTSEDLGKPVGSDAENGKVTFATLYGVEKAMQLAQQINTANCERMTQAFGDRADFLVTLAQNLLERSN